MSGATALGLALGLDLVLGEYPSALHPVVFMGHCISLFETRGPTAGRGRQLAWGALMAVFLPTLFGAGAALLVGTSKRLGWPGVALEALALKSTFALRELGCAGKRLRDALGRGALGEARHGLRDLCSRDPSRLGATQLAAAAIESLAENASDSILAPVFFYVLFGLPGAFAYRVVNTLDARIGYRGRYEWLGKPAARLDDLANLVPSRLTAILLLLAGLLRGADVRRGARTLWRDRRKTESPNAGRPMAAMAGLLRVELVKEGDYHLGDPLEPVDPDKVDTAWRLVSLAACLGIGFSVVALGAVHGLRY
ncbi:MAG TPA: adenosylcobinamide-phosphate synthase CbiB [Anaeromyxobacteraceae bacterium]|nr:adenosylcobinamide-phosphate synthase CbiB [Anaeromyxobacteraceae bacterium]